MALLVQVGIDLIDANSGVVLVRVMNTETIVMPAASDTVGLGELCAAAIDRLAADVGGRARDQALDVGRNAAA
jgi:hypothetical protein